MVNSPNPFICLLSRNKKLNGNPLILRWMTFSNMYGWQCGIQTPNIQTVCVSIFVCVLKYKYNVKMKYSEPKAFTERVL